MSIFNTTHRKANKAKLPALPLSSDWAFCEYYVPAEEATPAKHKPQHGFFERLYKPNA